MSHNHSQVTLARAVVPLRERLLAEAIELTRAARSETDAHAKSNLLLSAVEKMLALEAARGEPEITAADVQLF